MGIGCYFEFGVLKKRVRGWIMVIGRGVSDFFFFDFF